MKVLAYSSLEPHQIQLGSDAFDKSRFVMTFKNHIGNYKNIIQFQISPKRGKTGEEIPESLKLVF